MSLNNIYKNSFYSEPIPLWAFTVDFEIKTPNLDESELLTLSKSITNCPLAERSIQTTDIFFNGFKRSVPTQATTDGIISLTFSENTNLDVTRIISKMYKYSYNDLATSQDFFKEVFCFLKAGRKSIFRQGKKTVCDCGQLKSPAKIKFKPA